MSAPALLPGRTEAEEVESGFPHASRDGAAGMDESSKDQGLAGWPSHVRRSMTRIAVTAGLLTVLAGLFLAQCSDQTRLGSHDQHCIDSASPALDRLPASRSLLIQVDRLLFHSGDN